MEGLPAWLQMLLGGLLVLAAGFLAAALLALATYRRRKRAAAWHRAMVAWQEARSAAAEGQGAYLHEYAIHEALSEFERGRPDRVDALAFRSPSELSPAALLEFAAVVYGRMGYEVRAVGRDGVDLRLVNPRGKVEIVQVVQAADAVDGLMVRALFGALHHERAARAHLWAPGGFDDAARRWAGGKALVLADEREIGRMVEAAYR